MWWLTALLLVLAVLAGLVEVWRAGRREVHWSRESMLIGAFRFTDWAQCADWTPGVARIPDDLSVTRRPQMYWQRPGPQGALLIEERPRAGPGRHRRLLYLWVAHPSASGTAVHLDTMDHLAFDHGSRGTGATAIVRSVAELVPGVRAAWVSGGAVGFALEADEVTAPTAWANWLLELADAVLADRRPSAPPSRWELTDPD